MHVIANSDSFYIVDYPQFEAIELFDKRTGHIGVLQGDVAKRFRMDLLMKGSIQDETQVLALLDRYDALLFQRAVWH